MLACSATVTQNSRLNPYREVLIYIKDCPNRDERLASFIQTLQGAQAGHTIVNYQDWQRIRDRFEKHLWDAIGRMVGHLLRLGGPPVPMGAGGAMALKWQREKNSLVDLGLPPDTKSALELAEQIRLSIPR